MKNNFNLRTFLTENKLTANSKLLKEEGAEDANYPVIEAFKRYGIDMSKDVIVAEMDGGTAGLGGGQLDIGDPEPAELVAKRFEKHRLDTIHDYESEDQMRDFPVMYEDGFYGDYTPEGTEHKLTYSEDEGTMWDIFQAPSGVSENIEAFSDTIQVVGYPKTVEDALKVIERYERDRDPVSREEAKEIIADMRATDDDDFDRNITNLIVKAFAIKLKGVSEKKGKDHDGDGDVDGDDYIAAKDKAIKKAMGKDEQLKEAIKKIIKSSLLNEAATAKLSDIGDKYGDYKGMQVVINDLENIVTDMEGYFAKVRERVQISMDKIGQIETPDGMKVGAFLAPAIESAFFRDLNPVRKLSARDISLPQVKTISSADIAAARAAGDIEEQPKQTMFGVNEALNKELGNFGPDLKKRFEALGYTVGLFKNTQDIPDAARQRMLEDPKLVGITYHKDGDTGYETIRVYSNSKNVSSLEKVADYFNLTDAQFGPEKDAGFVVKQAINKNDGDILRSDIGTTKDLANFNLFRFIQGNYKDVKTTDKQTGDTDYLKQAAE